MTKQENYFSLLIIFFSLKGGTNHSCSFIKKCMYCVSSSRLSTINYPNTSHMDLHMNRYLRQCRTMHRPHVIYSSASCLFRSCILSLPFINTYPSHVSCNSSSDWMPASRKPNQQQLALSVV